MKDAINVDKVEDRITATSQGITNTIKEVAKQERIVEGLKNGVTTSAKDIAKAEKELNKLKATQEDLIRNLKVLNAQKSSIDGSFKAVSEARTAFEKATTNLKDLKAAGAKEEDIVAAREAVKLAGKNVTKAEKAALDVEANFISTSLEMTATAGDLAKTSLDQIKDNIDVTSKLLKTAKNEQRLARNPEDADAATANVHSLTQELKSLEDDKAFAKMNFQKADEAGQAEINKALNPIQQFAGVTQMIQGMVQGGVTINNQIIQAEIALIKGALEAFLAESDTIIKIFQALVTKFLDGLKDLGKTLAKLGSDRQRYWEGLSVTMTDLARAMK